MAPNIEEQKAALKQYASLKEQIKQLENQVEMLKPEVELIVVELNPTDKTIETDFGSFTMVPKRKYTYSEGLQLLEKTVKDTKKEEEATGVATYTETPYLLYKSSIVE
jgi:archaellum component FlaC